MVVRLYTVHKRTYKKKKKLNYFIGIFSIMCRKDLYIIDTYLSLSSLSLPSPSPLPSWKVCFSYMYFKEKNQLWR